MVQKNSGLQPESEVYVNFILSPAGVGLNCYWCASKYFPFFKNLVLNLGIFFIPFCIFILVLLLNSFIVVFFGRDYFISFFLEYAASRKVLIINIKAANPIKNAKAEAEITNVSVRLRSLSIASPEDRISLTAGFPSSLSITVSYTHLTLPTKA